MPAKTILTVLTFIGLILLPQVAPALKNYESLDPQKITALLDLPIPNVTGLEVDTAEVRIKRMESKAPANLYDSAHAMDHFYDALLKGGTVRILHYGDSPT